MNFKLLKKVLTLIFLKIKNEEVLDVSNINPHLFLIKFESGYLLINLQKPFMRLDYIQDIKDLKGLSFEKNTAYTSLKKQHLSELYFIEEEKEVVLIFEKNILSIRWENKCIPLLGKTINLGKQRHDEAVLSPDEIKACQKLKSHEAEFLFKKQNDHKKKLQKTLDKIQKNLDEIETNKKKLEEGLLFVMQHQEELSSKSQAYVEKARTYGFSKDIGSFIKKSYKMIKKLDKQKIKLPELIKIYENKLSQPFELKKPCESKKDETAKTFGRVFKISDNELIVVGTSAKVNDELTFKKASGNFYWFHAYGCPGAHVVIFSKNPTDDAISKARFLAKWFSKDKDEKQSEVIETLVKYLKKGSKAGEVMVSKKKIVQVMHDPKILSQLFPKLI